MPPFEKVLVANRGEIALRVIRACRDLSIRTVAVYSEADAGEPHVLAADEAYPIGPAEAHASYLDVDTILDVARRSGARAVHPGYGFLSENAGFAAAVEEAGLTFVGPSSEAISSMGDKLRARGIVAGVGVPIVPGSDGAIDDPAEALRRAEAIGFPVLLKATHGGGGKGMRVVRSAEETEAALRQASSEAASAFGEGSIYLEKYLERPRHVEIQILADSHGRTIHLGERDCSIQRRHQKIIEESPSPAVDRALRQEMGEAAVAIARAVDYEGVGTLEFLLDQDGRFYFLEMNTRLQVEHPVTELVTGIDLVASQFEVAAGGKIALPSREIEPRGASLECRLYAEDPYHGFIPSPGEIEGLRFPSGPSVRVDAGVAEGSKVTPYYDPMIAKLLTWGRDRSEALTKMRRALAECLVVGIQTNIPFHLFCLEDETFLAGDYSIRFVEERFDPSQVDKPDGLLAARIACVLRGAGGAVVGSRPRVEDGSGWKLSSRPGWRWS